MRKRPYSPFIYLVVTADEYELPLCVADTVSDLAEMSGLSLAGLYKSVEVVKTGRHRTGEQSGHKVIKLSKEDVFSDGEGEDTYADMYDMIIKEHREVKVKDAVRRVRRINKVKA